MASWTALNVYPDSDSEGEVDNTEELQIEEALKLYQRALKLHTDGAWTEAENAYADLFQSEIFQLDPDFDDPADGSNWASTSSLRLVFYLAYKNHGAFKLDRLRTTSMPQKEDVLSTVAQALDWFTTALGRDAGDPALWRETAQLCKILCSSRAARFALESILDQSAVGLERYKDGAVLVRVTSQSPEEYLASFHLRDLLQNIGDILAISHAQLAHLRGRITNMRLTKLMNPYPWLSVPTEIRTLGATIEAYATKRKVLTVGARTWFAVGMAILTALTDDTEDPVAPSSLEIVLPASEDGEDSRDTSPEATSATEDGTRTDVVITDENEDTVMIDASAAILSDPSRRRSNSSTRKRKSTSMGADTTETGRSRLSKRQRDKKDADAAAAAGTPESKQKVRQETQDEKLFNTVYDCFSPLGISLGAASSLKIYTTSDNLASDEVDVAKDSLHLQDFKKILQTWDDDKGNVILYGDGIQSVAEAADGMAYGDLEANTPSRPLLVGDEGLRTWVRCLNSRELCAEAVGLEWLRALCKRGPEALRSKKGKDTLGISGQSGWIKYSWPDYLKNTALHIATLCEDIAWSFFKTYEKTFLAKYYGGASFGDDDDAVVEWAQTMLEIYLEDLAFAERHRMGADPGEEFEDVVTKKKETAHRWAYLVGDMLQQKPRGEDGQLIADKLIMRHLWSRAVFTGSDESRELRLEYFEDLRLLLANEKMPPIELPNCTVMPEISEARAERELSKLKTVDFFDQIFKVAPGANGRTPGTVIETLEAVLKPGAILPYNKDEERVLEDIGRFLEGSSALYRLELWERLRNAYQQVDDLVEVMSCTLKCMQVVMDDLKSRSYVESSADHRQFVLLRSLRQVEGFLSDASDLFLGSPQILQGLQKDEILDAMATHMGLLRILHCYTFWEDAVMKTEAKASDLHSYRLVVGKLRVMLVKAWVVVYHLYSDALSRGIGSDNKSDWAERDKNEMQALLLRDLHEELGARHYCKLDNHVFLKMMFNEFLRFDNPDCQPDLLQCIHCRFHIMLCSDQFYFYEHKTSPEALDRATAMKLLDLFLGLAHKKGVARLTKSDLKTGLDKLIEVLGVPQRETNIRIAQNDSLIDQYLKSSINPLRMLGCLKGDLSLSTVAIGGDCGIVAVKGLYALQGKISLYPLRLPKRTGAIKNDDLTTAMNYFKYDLICRPDDWETWYRVGQTFDVQMEEAQTWSADQINSKRGILVALERSTILCYMMAVSLAIQHGDASDEETRKAISGLYTDFGYRVYSAARPPMAMESFWVDGFERHYSGRHGEGMYKARPHGELTLNNALRFALMMFENALGEGEGNWKNHYMLGKCMGKLHRKIGMFTAEQILQKYVDAINRTPEIKGNDFIFEPHHKLVSAACKHVLKEELEPQKACEILQASRFTKNRDPVDTPGNYVQYTLEVLKKMKLADKPKWHHRMTYRAARLRMEQLGDVAGARAEFATLFTNKAAQLSIWKPEYERPGRHFVFASHYTMFYVDLLGKLNDRTTLDILARRVRRLSTALFRHPEVWLHVFTTYISVLRITGAVPNDNEDEVFKCVSFDEFTSQGQRLESYCCRSDVKSQTLDLLLEVHELRRLNAGLAKTPVIDDLLADTYAKLYSELVPEILKQQAQQDSAAAANPMSVKNLMFDTQSEDGPPKLVLGMDELPLRGKLTKVSRRELVSKASSLCKEASLAPAKSASFLSSTPLTTAAAVPPSGSSAVDGNGSIGGSGSGLGDGDIARPATATGLDLSGLPNISIED